MKVRVREGTEQCDGTDGLDPLGLPDVRGPR
jgi:hypothetical protein